MGQKRGLPDQLALQRYVADLPPLMTLADARGKILFVIREDYKSSNNGRYFGAYLNWTHDKVSSTRRSAATAWGRPRSA